MECKPFEGFLKKLVYANEGIRELNVLTKPDILGRPVTPEDDESDPRTKARNTYLRGAFIAVMAMWEGYVKDLLEESGRIVFDSVSALDHKEKKEIIARSAKYRFKATDQKEMTEKTVALVYDIVVDLASPEASSTPIREFKADILRQTTGRTIPSVFFRSKDTTCNGIDDAFQKLFNFAGTYTISARIAEQNIVHEFIVKEPKTDATTAAKTAAKTPELKLDTPEGINDIIRLYYGVRCALAHGRNEKTFEKGGALYDYPSKEDLLNIVKSKDIEERLRKLYNNVKDYGSEAWLHYFGLINLHRFVTQLAFQLFKAVSWFIWEKFKLTIWDHQNYAEEQYVLETLDSWYI